MAKQLYTLEFPVRCSPVILYEFLSTPAGLQEWFADRVDDRDNIFSFTWNGSAEKAEVLEKEQDKFIRFHWLNAPKEEYFEFRIEKSEVTNQTPKHAVGLPGKRAFSSFRELTAASHQQFIIPQQFFFNSFKGINWKSYGQF
jgi:uncharacterized protein YndB with AHSA1/START domain